MKNTRLTHIVLFIPATAHASTGLAELGKIVFFMVYILPVMLLLTSAVTVWLSIKLGTRAIATCSIIALLLAVGNAAFLGILLSQAGRGEANELEYIVISAGISVSLIFAEVLLCVGLLARWAFTRTKKITSKLNES